MMTTGEPSELIIVVGIITGIIASIALSVTMNNLALGTGLGVGIFLFSIAMIVRNHRRRLLELGIIDGRPENQRDS